MASAKVDKVKVAVTQPPATPSSPITFAFKTVQALPVGEEYQATIYSIATTVLTAAEV